MRLPKRRSGRASSAAAPTAPLPPAAPPLRSPSSIDGCPRLPVDMVPWRTAGAVVAAAASVAAGWWVVGLARGAPPPAAPPTAFEELAEGLYRLSYDWSPLHPLPFSVPVGCFAILAPGSALVLVDTGPALRRRLGLAASCIARCAPSNDSVSCRRASAGVLGRPTHRDPGARSQDRSQREALDQ